MSKFQFLLFLSVIQIPCGLAQPNLDQGQFQIAKKQAVLDKDKDSPGCYMNCDFDPFFNENFRSIMGACFKSVKNPEIRTFETILQLNSDGAILKYWLDLETNFSLCATSSIIKLKFPNPPFSPYHARITVELKSNKD